MPYRSCGSCIGLGILVSALVHGMGLSLLLHHQPPVQGAGSEAGLELELAMFAPAGGGKEPSPLSAPDAKAAPSDEPPPNAEPPDLPPPDAEPLAQPEPVPAPPINEPNPPVASHEPPVDHLRVEAKLEPPAEPELEAKPQSQPEPAPRPKPKPQAKTRPRLATQPPAPQPPAEVKRTRGSAQVPPPNPPDTSLDVPLDTSDDASLDAPPGPGRSLAHPAFTAVTGGEKGTSTTGTNTEGAYLAELQRAIKRHQRYPEQARREAREGSTTLSFALLGDGRFEKVQVARSSGDRDLDQAAIESLQRLGHFKPIPLELGRGRWPLSVVIRFDLH